MNKGAVPFIWNRLLLSTIRRICTRHPYTLEILKSTTYVRFRDSFISLVKNIIIAVVFPSERHFYLIVKELAENVIKQKRFGLDSLYNIQNLTDSTGGL